MLCSGLIVQRKLYLFEAVRFFISSIEIQSKGKPYGIRSGCLRGRTLRSDRNGGGPFSTGIALFGSDRPNPTCSYASTAMPNCNSPCISMFFAAFSSLLCTAPHFGHSHTLILRSPIALFLYPQLPQIWEDGDE